MLKIRCLGLTQRSMDLWDLSFLNYLPTAPSPLSVMRSAFSIAAFAMIESSSNSSSECVMPTGVSKKDAIMSTVFQCYAGLSISFTGSSSANTDSSVSS